MKEFKHYRLFAAGLLIVVLALYGINTTPVQGDSTKEVVVVNTTANPVPVSGIVTGAVTGSVSITGTPTVNLGAANTVNLGAGNTVGINGSVQVGNSASSPVLVRDVDNAARNTFLFTGGMALNASTSSLITTLTTVPPGKRLVIEYVTGSVRTTPGQKVEAFLNAFPTAAGAVGIPLLLTPQGTFGVEDLFVNSQPTRFYLDAGATLSLVANLASTCTGNTCAIVGAAHGSFFISGYLVDCGPGPGCPLP